MRDLAHHPRVCQVAFLLVQKNQMRDNRFDYVVTLQISHAKAFISLLFCTLGQKSTFYPEITKNLMFEKCEFYDK